MASGVVTGSTWNLPGGNKIYLTAEWSDSVSGTTNTVTVKIKAYSYSIYGSWYCRLKINGQDYGAPRVSITHGTSSSLGSTIIRSDTHQLSYTGAKSISIYGAIENMDYTDVGGAGSVVISPFVSATISLSTITPTPVNNPPPVPSISMTNVFVNSKYLCESTIDATIPEVKDPNGDVVTYAVYGQVKKPGSAVWEKMGDDQGCIFWRSSTRIMSYNISQYPRASQFKIWARTFDDKMDGSSSSTEISNIYRNNLPNAVASVTPNGGYFNDNDISFYWPAATDSDGQSISYSIYKSENDNTFNLLKTSTNTNFTESYLAYPEGTKIKYKIITNDGISSSAEFITNYFVKNSKPTKPTSIFPNSGQYATTVNLTWNKSTDPENRGISLYNVYINNIKVGSTTTTSYIWTIPSADPENNKYLVSIEAVDVDGKSSEKGDASGYFYKAQKPSAPLFVKPLIGIYAGKIDVVWSSSSSLSNLKYNLEYKINQNLWTTLITNTTLTSYTFSIVDIPSGSTIQFRINAIDSLGQITDYAISALCTKNTIPQCPTIMFPLVGSVLSSSKARFCIKTYKDIDNQEQYITTFVNNSICDSRYINTSYNYSNKESVSSNIVFIPPILNTGTNYIRIRSNDGIEDSIYNTYSYTYQSIDKVVPGEEITYSKMNTLLQAINDMRKAYSLEAIAIPLLQVNEEINFDIITTMRVAIEEINNKINLFDMLNSKPTTLNWITSSQGDFIYADVINNLIDNLNKI